MFIKNKKVIILLVAIFLLLIVFIFNFVKNSDNFGGNINNNVVNNSKNSVSSASEYDKIIKKINDKKTFNLYITSVAEECIHCSNVNKVMKFFNDVYGIKYDKIVVDSSNNKELNKINKLFSFPDGYLTAPAIVFIKDGVAEQVLNEQQRESEIKKVLVERNMIDAKYLKIGEELFMTEDFEKIYNSDVNSLMVLDINSIKNRVYIHKLAEKNNFTFYTINISSVAHMKTYMMLADEVGEEFNVPIIVFVRKGKVLDYLIDFDEDSINNFLKRNQIIK